MMFRMLGGSRFVILWVNLSIDRYMILDGFSMIVLLVVRVGVILYVSMIIGMFYGMICMIMLSGLWCMMLIEFVLSDDVWCIDLLCSCYGVLEKIVNCLIVIGMLKCIDLLIGLLLFSVFMSV